MKPSTWILLAAFCAVAVAALAAIAVNRVSIASESEKRVIRSNGWPDHKPGQFRRRGNPNTLSPQDYTFRVPLSPKVAEHSTPLHHAIFGVAVNGVPFDPGTAEFWNNDRNSGWNYEAMSGKIDLGLDEHHAHVQPTGAYHYHGLPTGLVQRLGGDAQKMILIGYAADGFPIYSSRGHSDPKDAKSALKTMRSSYQLKKGVRPNGPGRVYDGTFTEDYEYVAGSGDLDECNGRAGVTPEYPQGSYHYYVTASFPIVSREWRGTADESFQKRGPGPGLFGPRRPGGPPPFGPLGGPPPGPR